MVISQWKKKWFKRQYHNCVKCIWGRFGRGFVKIGLEICSRYYVCNKGINKQTENNHTDNKLPGAVLVNTVVSYHFIFTCRWQSAGLWVAGGRGRVLPARRTPTNEIRVMDPRDCRRLGDAGESTGLSQYGSLQLPFQ